MIRSHQAAEQEKLSLPRFDAGADRPSCVPQIVRALRILHASVCLLSLKRTAEGVRDLKSMWAAPSSSCTVVEPDLCLWRAIQLS